jgi:enterochelin esterase-like enzyme
MLMNLETIDIPESLRQGTTGTDLLGTYWPAAIALAVAAGLVALWWIGRRRPAGRRGRVARTLGHLGPAVVLVVMALALGVNAWVGYFPSVQAVGRWLQVHTDPPAAMDAGTVPPAGGVTAAPTGDRVTDADHGYAYMVKIPSTSVGVADSDAWVYVPPDYDKPGNTERYPVVYALHGAPGTGADWFSGGQIDHVLDELITGGYVPPMIAVSPDMNAGGQPVDTEPLDIPGGPQLESFVVNDVLAWTDGTLRTRDDAAYRVMSGMSAGGLGALVYGLHHPDVFGGVISILPYSKPYTDAVVADPRALARNTPADIIAERTSTPEQPVFLGQGDGNSQAEARDLERRLRASGQPVTLQVYEGLAHNWVAARSIMPYGLVWVSDQLGWQAESDDVAGG